MKPTNNSLDILIVEDELSFALELEILVEKSGYNVVGPADNSARALELIFSHSPDFILMDISIGGDLSGTEIGQKIKHLDIPILFITSFGNEKHYQEAQKSNMIGFLVKPLDKYSLRTAIDLAIKTSIPKKEIKEVEKPLGDANETPFVLKKGFFFKKRGIYYKVLLTDILFVKSDKNYCEIITCSGQVFVSRITLSKIEQILPSDYFLRIHRQYLINTDNINSIDFQNNIVKMASHNLPLSRNYRRSIDDIMYKLK